MILFKLTLHKREKISSRRCNTTFMMPRYALAFIKVPKPPESLKIEARHATVCFLYQGLIPGFLGGSQVSLQFITQWLALVLVLPL